MSTKSIRFLLVLAMLVAISAPVLAGGKHCEMKEASHGECPVKHAKVVSTDEVVLTGQLLCRHCNLHETESCEKVFVSEDDTRFALCPESDIEAAESISDHGEATITVTGTRMELEDGSSVLRIASAERS